MVYQTIKAHTLELYSLSNGNFEKKHCPVIPPSFTPNYVQSDQCSFQTVWYVWHMQLLAIFYPCSIKLQHFFTVGRRL